MFPAGFKIDNTEIKVQPNNVIDNTEVKVKPNNVVENSGVVSKYTNSEVITRLKNAINSGQVDKPRCSLTEGEFHTFFSHRKNWKIAILCPKVSEGTHRATKEYLYELNEWDDTIKYTPTN